MSAKQVLRRHVKAILANMRPESRAEKSKRIIGKVLESPQYINCRRVGIYLSMTEEVHTEDLLVDAITSNRECFIPKYDPSSRLMDMLKLHSMDDYHSLPLTKWNIKQPDDADTTRANALTSGGLDLIIVPGLGFTLGGKRLGRGKGYYDTFLTRHKQELGISPKTIALAYSEQLLPDIPTDEHDYIIDMVLSDEN